jgi:hypothetical protein
MSGQAVQARRPMFHPHDDLLAVIDDPADAEAAIAALGRAGIADEHIHVFRGRAEIEALARAWWKHSGVPALLAPFLAAFLSDEFEIEKRYEAEGAAGHTVLAVHAAQRNDIKRATTVLGEFAAHDMRYFGRWTITELWPRVASRAAREGLEVEKLLATKGNEGD